MGLVLPEGVESVHGERYGSSGWSFTAKIVTVQNGTTVSYFLKVSLLHNIKLTVSNYL